MDFGFEVTGHALKEGEIGAFEAGARIRLPPQYRAFILKQNGCLPVGMIKLNTGFDADLSEILPLYLKKNSEGHSVVSCTKDLVWFAVDSGGGVFGIAHTGSHFGKVVWTDLPHQDGGAPKAADCELVAPTFDAFIASLASMD